MAQFEITIKKESYLNLVVDTKDKLDAIILAKQKAKNREGWTHDSYDVVKIKTI
jgi:hypothetical protein